jgi:Helix-turn-helix domain
MDDTYCRRFFQEPTGPLQRQYEALRAVFLDGLSQKEAAGRFGYSYDAFRQLVHQFRHGCAAGTPPPFFSSRVPGDPRPSYPRHQFGRTSQPLPMSEP